MDNNQKNEKRNFNTKLKDRKIISSMDRKALMRCFLMIAVAIVIIGIIQLQKGNENAGNLVDQRIGSTVALDKQPTEKDEVNNKLEDVSREPYVEKPTVTITADDFSDYGIELDTTFIMKHIEEVTIEQIKDNLSIVSDSNPSEFEVLDIGEKTYKIQLSEPLAENKILKLKYSFDNQIYGYAFKTKEPFWVQSVYPADGSNYVDVKSGIEVNFSRLVTEDAENYFEILPEVIGTFIYKDYKMTFIPDDDLSPKTNYTIRIKEGYTIEGEEIQPMSWNIQTDYDYQNGFELGGYEIVNAMSLDDFQILKVQTGYLSKQNFDTIEVYQITGDPLELLKINSHQGIMNQILTESKGKFIKSIPVDYEEKSWSDSYLILKENVDKGFYYFTAAIGQDEDGCFVQVTDKNAYLVIDEDEFLLWVEQKDSEDMSGEILYNGEIIGRTNEKGLANIMGKLPQKETAFISYRKDDEEIYLPTRVWEASDYVGYDYYSSLYTDRGIYKTTDKIYVSGFLKSRKGKKVQNIRIQLRYDDYVIKSKNVSVNSIGTYETFFEYEDFEYDSLQVVAIVEDVEIESLWLYIADFEKPTYLVNSKLDKEYVMQGETFNYYGSISYFDGTPLPGGTLDINFNGYELNFKDENNKKVSEIVEKTIRGEYSATVKVDSFSSSWRPTNAVIYTSTRDLQEFYDSTYDYITVFPKTMMLELDTKDSKESILQVNVSCHDVNITNIKENVYNPDEFRGKELEGEELSISVNERYYEKIFVRQSYNAIYKETYDIYKYVKHENVVYTDNGITDETGICTFEYDNIIKGRSYTIDVKGKDRNDSLVLETGHYGSYFHDYFDNEPYYQIAINSKDIYSENIIDYNDIVTVELLRNGESISEVDNDKMLLIEERDGINHYQLIDSTITTFKFDESRLPDTYVKLVYFNGAAMTTNYYMGQTIYINQMSRELDIDIEYNQESYEPGEIVEYNLLVKDKNGTPTKASVNVSVVDEAVFKVSEDNNEPLRNLYSADYNTNIIGEFILSINFDMMGGAEKGGEGGPDGFRSDFADTGYFGLIETDLNGIGTGSFKLPDNITSWRMTLTGFTKDALAVKVKSNISSGLPFFAEVMVEDEYLVGDQLFARIKSAGAFEFMEADVDTHFWVVDENGASIIDRKVASTFASSVFVNLGKLDIGEYQLFVEVSSKEAVDRSRYDFKVVQEVARYEIQLAEELTKDLDITHNNNIVSLDIYNQEAYDYYDKLRRLTFEEDSKSNLRSLTAKIAANHVAELFNEEESNILDIYNYLDNDMIKQLVNSSGDMISTSRLFAIGLGNQIYSYDLDRIDRKRMSYLTTTLNTSANYIGALWLSSILNKPDLNLLDEAYNDYEFLETDEIRLTLIQALIDAGEITKGSQLLDRFMWEKDIDLNKSKLFFTEDAADSELIAYMLLASSAKLEKWDLATRIYDYVNKRENSYRTSAQHHVSEPEQLLYLMSMPRPIINGKVKVRYLNTTQNEDLGFNNILSMILSPEEVESLEIEAIEGKFIVNKQYIALSDDLANIEGNQVAKRYYKESGEGPIKVGDMVIVEFEFTRTFSNHFFRIQDALPAGLTFFDNLSQGEHKSLYAQAKGSMVNLYGSVSNYGIKDSDIETNITYKYRTIATAPGSYGSEPMLIIDASKNDFWIGDETRIEIQE